MTLTFWKTATGSAEFHAREILTICRAAGIAAEPVDEDDEKIVVFIRLEA